MSLTNKDTVFFLIGQQGQVQTDSKMYLVFFFTLKLSNIKDRHVYM